MVKASRQEHRVLTIAVIIAVLFGAYFLRHYFSVITFAAISAYLFNPVYKWWQLRIKRSSSAASLTVLTAGLVFIIPASLVVVFTVLQINHLVSNLQHTQELSLGNLGQRVLDWINQILAYIPSAKPVTADQFTAALQDVATAIAKGAFNIITSSVSSISAFFTALIIYIYVFLNLLTHQAKVISMARGLNPLGPKMADQYFEKAGDMTSAMVRGQFIIAACQGLAEALILQIAGLHGIFFFLFMLLTVLSIIPLGGGIVAIPIGIAMLLLGDVWQGLFVLAGHFLLITNIDNVLRPYLVPKHVRLNPALTLLAVFSGIAMFGFLGIIIGPVIMIILKLTIDAYLEIHHPPAK